MIETLRRIGRTLARLRRPPPEPTLTLDEQGFTVHYASGARHAVRWDEIGRVEAYKRDLLAVDLICMDLWLPGHDTWLLVHEEMPGWDEWTETLAVALPLDVPGWYRRIVLPPFAENRSVIFARRANAGGEASNPGSVAV